MLKLIRANKVLALAVIIVLLLYIVPANADLVVVGQSGGGLAIGGSVSGGTATRVLFLDGSGNLANDADMTFSTDTLTVTKASFGVVDAANSINAQVVTGQLCYEGSTADAVELCIAVADPTVADKTWTIPNLTGAAHTFVDLETSQTISASKTFSAGLATSSGISMTGGSLVLTAGTSFIELASTGAGIWTSTNMTPDAPILWTNTASNSYLITERADSAFDFNNGPCGTGACTDPTLIIPSHNQNTTNFRGYAFYGSAGRALKSLTAASATAVVQIPIASGAGTGGELRYTVFATDATDHQARFGKVTFSTVNKGGTETCAVYGVDSAFTANPDQTKDGSGAGAISSGTLTYTWGVDTTPSNACNLTLNAASSLTETVLDIYYEVDLVGPGQPTPQ